VTSAAAPGGRALLEEGARAFLGVVGGVEEGGQVLLEADAVGSGSSAPRTMAALAVRTAIGRVGGDLLRQRHGAPSRSAGGTTYSTRPIASASCASTVRPVRIISIARGMPMRRDRRWVPPLPGIRPRLTSPNEKVAVSAANTMSHSRASSTPPPTARPFTAATIGLSKAAMPSDDAARMRLTSAIGWSASSFENSRRSMPAEKALSPLPVSTAAPTSGSACSASRAWRNSARICRLMAFMASGRFSARTATRPWRVTVIVVAIGVEVGVVTQARRSVQEGEAG
jgi:hypothetical protein